VNNLEAFLEPLFAYFKQDRQPEEGFGDFCDRVGFEALHQFADTYTALPSEAKDQRRRVTLSSSVYEQLKQVAADRDKSMKEIVESAIAKYLASS